MDFDVAWAIARNRAQRTRSMLHTEITTILLVIACSILALIALERLADDSPVAIRADAEDTCTSTFRGLTLAEVEGNEDRVTCFYY